MLHQLIKGILIMLCVFSLTACKDPESGRCSTSNHNFSIGSYNLPESVWQADVDQSITGELDWDTQQRLSAALDQILLHAPAASVAVAIPGEGIWSATRGITNADFDMPAISNEAFQAASITKTFTATIIMQLIAEGKLHLDDNVERWFPALPEAHQITIEQLLRHQSGIPNFNSLATISADYLTPDQLIQWAAKQQLLFCPGTQWSYSNTGYIVLGRIIEQTENLPLAQVFKERISDPLGLVTTQLRTWSDGANRVSGHNDGVVVNEDALYATAWAAGGIASSAEDLVLFWHALLSNNLVDKENLQHMFTDMSPMMLDGYDSYYGMGVQVYDDPESPGMMIGHSGGIAGFTSVVAYVVQDGVYIAVLFNDKQVPAEAGLQEILRVLQESP